MLTLTGLHKTYGELTVFESLDFHVDAGEVVALVGPSGSGKTTLLNIIAGLIQPDSGTIDAGSDRIGYVFQEDRLFPWLTVEENIRAAGAGNESELIPLVEAVGLAGFEKYYPDELSGGMRQRASLARAYMYHSDILLMDEPFSALDYNLRQEMLQTLLKVRARRNNAIIFVTHQIAEALAIASRLVVMSALPTRIIKQYRLDPVSVPREVKTPQLIEIQREIRALHDV